MLSTVMSISTSRAMQHPIQNQICAKANILRTQNSESFTCTLVGKKNIWVLDSVQNPTPLVSTKKQTIYPMVVFVTAMDPTLAWSQESMNLAKISLQDAMKWWSKISKGKIAFASLKVVQPIALKNANTCDPQIISQLVLKTLKIHSLKSGTELFVMDLDAQCGYAGVATQNGRTVLISRDGLIFSDIVTSVDPTNPSENLSAFKPNNEIASTIAHEMGHNFGLTHSSLVGCPTSKLLRLSKSCTTDEYGDSEDFMGNPTALSCMNQSDGSNIDALSATQMAVGFGYTKATAITSPGSFTVFGNSTQPVRSLYSIPTKLGTAYIEFSSAGSSECYYRQAGSSSFSGNVDISKIANPSIEIRIVGNDQAFPLKSNTSNDVQILEIGRQITRIAGPFQDPLSFDGYSQLTWSGIDPHFQLGEATEIPNTNLILTVTATTADSATFSIFPG